MGQAAGRRGGGFTLLALLALLAAIVFGIGHESQFVFSPEEMSRIAREVRAP